MLPVKTDDSLMTIVALDLAHQDFRSKFTPIHSAGLRPISSRNLESGIRAISSPPFLAQRARGNLWRLTMASLAICQRGRDELDCCGCNSRSPRNGDTI